MGNHTPTRLSVDAICKAQVIVAMRCSDAISETHMAYYTADTTAPDATKAHMLRARQKLQEALKSVDAALGMPQPFEAFRAEVERISDDYHPDRPQDTARALQEMRDALSAALSQARS